MSTSVSPVAPCGVVGAYGNGVCTAVLCTTISSADSPDCPKSKDFLAIGAALPDIAECRTMCRCGPWSCHITVGLFAEQVAFLPY